MKKGIILLALVFVMIVSGCVSTRAIKYETNFRPVKPESFPIEIFESSDIERPYKVIGVVQANAGKLHSPTDTIEHLKIKAREMGGDALMNLR